MTYSGPPGELIEQSITQSRLSWQSIGIYTRLIHVRDRNTEEHRATLSEDRADGAVRDYLVTHPAECLCGDLPTEPESNESTAMTTTTPARRRARVNGGAPATVGRGRRLERGT